MLNVVCIKRGTAYTAEYVNKLYSMVQRHLTLPHKFVCMTENSEGLSEHIVVISFSDLRLRKWWNKLELFQPPPQLEGRILFFDLDTVIVGSIDEIARYEGNFAILRDVGIRDPHIRPTPKNIMGMYGSAIMSIKPGFGRFIWDECQQSIESLKQYPGDQGFIGRRLLGRHIEPDLWQDLFPHQIMSFKYQKLIQNFYREKERNLRVVCFHGKPRPHEVVEKVQWVREHWK
jgi:hypothetical protein